MRIIRELRVRTVVVATAAVITAGTAIPLYATGTFDSPAPACYLSQPASGATLTGSATLNANCGASTTNVEFLLDGTFVVGSDGSSPFSLSWNSATAVDGAHTINVIACDINSLCAPSGSVAVSTSNVGGAPLNTVPPAVSGSLLVGSSVSCSTGTWTGDTSGGFTYQWKDGAGNIASATSSSYTIGSGENGLFLHCTVTASGTGGSASADSSVVGPVTTGGSLTTAHVWISVSGNDSTCQRNTAAVSYPTAIAASPPNVCATGPKAYTVANLGDNILVEGTPFTVTTQWSFTRSLTKTVTNGKCNYNYGGASDFTQCETIEPASGQSLTFNCSTGACNGSGTAPGTQIFVCVSGLSIQNATVTETDWTDTYNGLNKPSSNTALQVGKGDSTCASATTAQHDDYFASMTFGGQVQVVGGSFNTWVVNSVAANEKNLPWQFAGSNSFAVTVGVNNSGVVGTTFQGYNFVANNGRHMECVHVDTAENNETWAGDRFQQCPIESLFFETEAASQHDNLIENNYFDAGSGGGPFKFTCRASGCTESNNIIRFNNLSGAFQFDCEAPTGGTCNIDNNVFYGNVKIGCATVTTNGATIVGTKLLDQGYNVLTVAKSGWCTANTSSYSATVTYVSSGAPNYNLDLNGAQTATNFVPNSVTWPLNGGNIYGAARSGANTNAGAN